MKLFIIALSLSFAVEQRAHAQEAWQTDYNQFLTAVAPYVQAPQTQPVVAELLAKFANKPIAWEGQFASIALNAKLNKPIANITVPSRKMAVAGQSRLFDSVPHLEFFPSPANAAIWEKVPVGQQVKFRTTLVNPVLQILDGIRYVNFVFGDLEFVDPSAKPTITGVTNGASFLEGIAPASWITIRGTNLSATTRIWTAKDFQGKLLPVALDGVSVKVNGRDALVYFISPTQINALSPDDTSRGPVFVTVTTDKGASAPATANLGHYSPGFFAFDADNRKYAAAVHPDGAYAAKAGLFANTVASRPVRAGDRILLFGTGFGPTASPAPAAQLVETAKSIENPSQLFLRIGGMPAQIEFAGLTSSGLYQFNAVVPNLPPGDHLVIADIGGQSSLAKVAITVAQ